MQTLCVCTVCRELCPTKNADCRCRRAYDPLRGKGPPTPNERTAEYALPRSGSRSADSRRRKTTRRHCATNAVMPYPVPPDVWQPFFLNGSPLLLNEACSYKKRLKMVKTGFDRQEQVVEACQNIRIPRHSLSQPVFSMFSHRFSSVFGLFTIVQGSVKTRSNVTPPLSGAASPSTLGRERREHKDSPKKRLHHQQTEQTKCPWLHCQGVGPLQRI